MTENKVEKPYELRKLKSTDLFLVLNLVKKIGIATFADAVVDDGFKQIFTGTEDKTEEDYANVGKTVFNIIQLIIERLTDCQNEIYDLLEAVSNLNRQQLEDLDMDVFMEMVVELVGKDEFRQLFTRVVSLLNKGN